MAAPGSLGRRAACLAHTWAQPGAQQLLRRWLGSGPGAPPPGAAFSLTKAFRAEEVASFAAMTGDSNPIHVSRAAAEARGLAGAVLPGMLSASLFPAVIGSTFPGALYLTQSLAFKNPCLVGDELTATVTVQRASGRRVVFRTVCRRAAAAAGGEGEVVVEGEALALLP